MDRQGQVFKSGQVVLGPNPISDGTVPPPSGFREGEDIDFTDTTKAQGNVVTGEAPSAFIDLETVGLGATAGSVREFIQGGGGSGGVGISGATTGLCPAIEREDLAGLLSFFETRQLTRSTIGAATETRPGFLDEQGHDIDDLAASWKSFFDFYDVVSCRIAPASTTVQQAAGGGFDQGDVFVVSGSMEIIALEPVLSLFAPADDPTTLEGENESDFATRGEQFVLGPVLFSQVASFYEGGDGRGWQMRIIDDDHTEGQIDRADQLLAQRDFTHRRSRRRQEGFGRVFLAEEESPSDSLNSEYIFQFIEKSEARGSDPAGGWHQPIEYVLWFDTFNSALPYVTFTVPFSFDVLQDSETQDFSIIGGECATFGLLASRPEGQTTITQDSSLTLRVEGAAGWRFFNPLGVFADANILSIWDSHLFFEGPDTFRIPDEFSSASVVNLDDLLNVPGFKRLGPPEDQAPTVIPDLPMSQFLSSPDFILNPTSTVTPLASTFVPLGKDLKLAPEDMLTIPFSTFQSNDTIQFVDVVDASDTTIARAFTDDFLVTFRRPDQSIFPQPNTRLYYATFRLKSVNNPDNTEDNVVFTWRFNPDEDFIPFNAIKEGQDGTGRGRKTPSDPGPIKPNFHQGIEK